MRFLALVYVGHCCPTIRFICRHYMTHFIQPKTQTSTNFFWQISTHEHYVQDLEYECHLQPNHVDDVAMASVTNVRNKDHTIAEEDRVILK